MSLDSYSKKRHFNRTPEPKGQTKQSSGPLTFVVQKHQASHLHYDFRLELNGILKSWAVPKGPSMDDGEKRLAMMVEDHPVDYAQFEGIIPKDNYGAGTVMIWDKGVYSPIDTVERDEAEKVLNQQLEKGHLTFILLGEKLKGEFALIKLAHAEENAWLLIKKGDEYASNKDILKEDDSVVTERSMVEIGKQAEKKKEIWHGKPKDLDFHEAKKTAMPREVSPMLATAIDQPFDDPDWLFEIKWDGYRAIAEIEAGKVKLYSRNQQPYNQKFAPIAESLTKFPGNAVLDGEIVALDRSGHPNFQLLQDFHNSKGTKLIYYVFDLLYFDGYNLKTLPLRERKDLLRQILPPLPNVEFSDHVEGPGIEFFKQANLLKLEGVMAKKGQSTYREGVRSEEWLKIKTTLRQEAIICGYTKPRGGRKHLGALVLGIYKKGKLQYVGHAGGGFNDKTLESTLKKLEPLAQEDCPFEVKPETNAPVTWVKPVLVCEVEFSAWTNDQQMRHPIFMGLREDKESKEVGEERTFAKEAHGKGEKKEIVIDKRSIEITNMSKVFWPQDKITKGDLIDYYRAIAPVILPYLKFRPESLLRYPNGIEGESFFQKDASNLKAGWLTKGRIRSDKKEIDYLMIQNEASLIYVINLGCIDLHPWNSVAAHLDKPDYLILDLDPEGVKFEQVGEVALVIRELLEELDIPSFCKTSGASGLHIYIPMGAKYSYEQTRVFAQLLCTQVLQRKPNLTSMTRSPKDRQNRVYLDYLQNARGQTLASVYSVRPLPGATVSTPLKWSEVTPKLHPSQFTIKNIPKRLDKEDDLFKDVLGPGINMKKVLKNLELLAKGS